jgi:hypothetical protein
VNLGVKSTHSHTVRTLRTSLLTVRLYEYHRVIFLDEKLQVHKIYALIYVHICFHKFYSHLRTYFFRSERVSMT